MARSPRSDDASRGMPDADRRRFLKIAALGIAAAPVAGSLFARRAFAEDMPMVDESDPLAQSLGYMCDASKNPKHVEGQFCQGCQLYTGAAGSEAGPCTLFPGKQVCAKGWCTSFIKKA